MIRERILLRQGKIAILLDAYNISLLKHYEY